MNNKKCVELLRYANEKQGTCEGRGVGGVCVKRGRLCVCVCVCEDSVV